MKAERKVFGKLQNTYEPPDLIEIQTKSYREFLQADVPPAKRAEQGLQAIFHEIFPVESFDGRYVLDFVKYELLPPKRTLMYPVRGLVSQTVPIPSGVLTTESTGGVRRISSS